MPCSQDSDGGERYSTEDLAEEFDAPSIDPARDTVAVLDDDGTLVACGQVMRSVERVEGEIRAVFFGGVHPTHTGQGIGSELLRRLAELGAAEPRF